MSCQEFLASKHIISRLMRLCELKCLNDKTEVLKIRSNAKCTYEIFRCILLLRIRNTIQFLVTLL
jgi:hypothetical protein